jgi:hypothetical protein
MIWIALMCMSDCTYSSMLNFNNRYRMQRKAKCKMYMLLKDQWCTYFCCKSNLTLMYRKMDKTVYGNFACMQPPFSAYRTQLTGKRKYTFRKNGRFLSRNNITGLYLCNILLLYMISDSEGHGNTYKPVRLCLYACCTYKKP